ncbi:hypothetical protein R5R35_011149 [Gryllus longicercus]|uniref:Uncharacterized protein n=1 Tax=Gryllus longicercus TaxID=2509291 RepID=A0AAN9Z412_9ORTH
MPSLTSLLPYPCFHCHPCVPQHHVTSPPFPLPPTFINVAPLSLITIVCTVTVTSASSVASPSRLPPSLAAAKAPMNFLGGAPPEAVCQWTSRPATQEARLTRVHLV